MTNIELGDNWKKLSFIGYKLINKSAVFLLHVRVSYVYIVG